MFCSVMYVGIVVTIDENSKHFEKPQINRNAQKKNKWFFFSTFKIVREK